MPCYILRAGDTDMVKIGWAVNPEARRRDLQTGHYEELRVLRVIDGPRTLEGWLHRHFRSHRVRREWHRFQPQMLTVTADDVRPKPRQKPVREPKSVMIHPAIAPLGISRSDSLIVLGVSNALLSRWEREGFPDKVIHQIEALTPLCMSYARRMSEERKAKISAGVSESWRAGSLRRTFNMQHAA